MEARQHPPYGHFLREPDGSGRVNVALKDAAMMPANDGVTAVERCEAFFMETYEALDGTYADNIDALASVLAGDFELAHRVFADWIRLSPSELIRFRHGVGLREWIKTHVESGTQHASHEVARASTSPLHAKLEGRSAEAVIRDLLRQAEEKGKTGDVAQYLVGAKLMLHFKRDIPVHPANKADRKSRSDMDARSGDFEIENAVLEVAVGLPDEKHLAQIAEALEDSDAEVWLLTRSDRVGTWMNELEKFEGVDCKRVVVTAVEAFVGQNVTELGEFSVKGKAAQLQALIDLYNERWVCQVGSPGIRIIVR